MRIITATVVALTAATFPVPCQDLLRSEWAATDFFKSGASDGALFIRAGSNSLVLEQYRPDLASVQVVVPFSQVGDILTVDAAQGQHLVSGKDPQGHGWILRVQTSFGLPPTLSILQSATYGAAFDPLSLAYNPVDGNLYVMDYLAPQVLYASWAPGTPLPTTFAVAIGLSQFPELVRGHTIEAAVDEAGPQAGVEIYNPGGHFPVERVRHVNGQWLLIGSGVTDLQPAPAHVWMIENRMFACSFGPLVLTGPAGAYELLDEDTGIVVHSGTLPTANQPHSVVLAQELLAGHTHSFRQPGSAVVSAPFWPTVRYGATPATDSVRWTRGIVRPKQAHVGNDEFTVVAGLNANVPSAFASSVYLFVGVRDATGADPVIVNGETAFLSAPSAILGPIELTFDGQRSNDSAAFEMPIPDNSALSGVVFLWQFVAWTPGGQVAVSDVFGTRILPSNMGLRAGSGPRVATIDAVRTAWRMLGADEDGGLAPAMRSVYDRVWQRIRERLERR